jgi:hypothetical protein
MGAETVAGLVSEPSKGSAIALVFRDKTVRIIVRDDDSAHADFPSRRWYDASGGASNLVSWEDATATAVAAYLTFHPPMVDLR